jgi:hypothetical protein
VDTIMSARLDANADPGRRQARDRSKERLDQTTREEQHGTLGGVLEQDHDAILGSFTRERGAARPPAHDAPSVINS